MKEVILKRGIVEEIGITIEILNKKRETIENRNQIGNFNNQNQRENFEKRKKRQLRQLKI